MEFWGVEVKLGESLKVVPENSELIHISSACLGEVSKDKGSDPVSLYVKFDGQKLQLGTLSSEKFPQTSFDLVFGKKFELSHNWKYGSVFFSGFRIECEPEHDSSEDEASDDTDSEEEDIPLNAANGKPVLEVNGAKPVVNASKQKKNQKDASTDDSSDSSDEDSSEDELMANGQIKSSSEDESDEDSDEETPKKTEGSNKRVAESSKETPVPVKKAKFVTPEKTGGRSSVHVDTPYPKQAGKSAANNKQPEKQETPKSSGDYSCKPCNRSFKTEDALGSHNKAKHSAK